MLRLFVGNIPHACDDAKLRRWLEKQNHVVTEVQILRDRITGHSRGFGFVEIKDPPDPDKTIASLNGQPMAGRRLTVNRATPKTEYGKAVGGG